MMAPELKKALPALRKEFRDHAEAAGQSDNAGTYIEWLEVELLNVRRTLLFVQRAVERLEHAL